MAKKAQAEKVIRSLEETARFFGVSNPTLKAWVQDGCPVEEKGGNGVAYKFDIHAVADWRSGRKEEEERQAEARAEQDARLQMELLGGDMLPDPEGSGGKMTAKQRTEYIRAELDKVKLAKERRELVRADELRDALMEPLALTRERLRGGLIDQLRKRFDWSDDEADDALAALDEILTDLVDDIEAMVSKDSGDAEAA